MTLFHLVMVVIVNVLNIDEGKFVAYYFLGNPALWPSCPYSAYGTQYCIRLLMKFIGIDSLTECFCLIFVLLHICVGCIL